jgi:hypothetical protein
MKRSEIAPVVQICFETNVQSHLNLDRERLLVCDGFLIASFGTWNKRIPEQTARLGSGIWGSGDLGRTFGVRDTPDVVACQMGYRDPLSRPRASPCPCHAIFRRYPVAVDTIRLRV